MKKLLVFILIFFQHSNYSFAQQRNTYINGFLDYFNRQEGSADVSVLERRINHLIKKMPQLRNVEGIRQFNLLECHLDTPFLSRNDYINYSFLEYVRYGYYNLSSKSILSKKKHYMRTCTLVTDSVGHLLAHGDARNLYLPFSNYIDEREKNLAVILFKEKYDFILFLINNLFDIYFCIKDNKIVVLQWTGDGYSHVPWEEYVEKNWERNNHSYFKGVIDGSSYP